MQVETSRAYADDYSVSRATATKQRVFDELSKPANAAGMTADEVASNIEQSVLSVRPEVCHLYKTGKLVKTGMRRPSSTGHASNVWMLKVVA